MTITAPAPTATVSLAKALKTDGGAKALLAERRIIAEQLKDLEARKAQIDAQVRDALDTAGVTQGTVGGTVVVRLVERSRTDIDVRTLRATLPEVAERFARINHFTVLQFA